MSRLIELAERCENLALEQVECALESETWDEADPCATAALAMFELAERLRTLSQGGKK